MSQLTLSDIAGPAGPFLLEIKRFDPDRGTQFWQLLRSVKSLDEGLRVASNMCASYSYRLFLGAEWGYLRLEWADDPNDPDMCLPKWVQ